MFSIDYDKLVSQLLPVALRKSKFIALIKCLIAPVKVLYTDFNTKRTHSLNRLNYTGQVIYLIKYLADYYSYDELSFTYWEPTYFDWIYIFNEGDGGGDTYLYSQLEVTLNTSLLILYLFLIDEVVNYCDFAIYHPDEPYMFDDIVMKELLSEYVITGKQFIVSI